METSKRNLKKFGTLQKSLINNRKDFFLLSLSITSGLLFFVIALYIILKASSFNFRGEKTEKEELGNLDNLDTLESLEEEVVVKKEEKTEEEKKEN